jgi:hypothetical protein
MQRVTTESRGPLPGGAEARYLAEANGLRVSWAAVLSGAVALLAVTLIVWALALAIVSLAAHPTGGSLKGAAIALWIGAMVATLLGGFVGGWFASIGSGADRRELVLAQAFLAWGLAFLVSFAFKVWMFRTALVATASTLADAVAAQQETPMMPGPARADLVYAGRVALDYVRGAGWSWFGTWLASGVLTLAGAAFGARRAARARGETIPEAAGREHAERPGGPASPLTPAPSA